MTMWTMDDLLKIWLCLLPVNRCLPPDHPSMTVFVDSAVCEQVHTPRPTIHDCLYWQCCVWTGAYPQTIHPWLCLLCVNRCPPLWLSVVCEQVPAPRHHLSMTVSVAREQVPAPRHHPSVTVVWTGACPHSWLCLLCVYCANRCLPPDLIHLWLCLFCVNRCPPPNLIHPWLCLFCVNRCPPPNLIHPGEAERAAGVAGGAEDQAAAAGRHRGWAGVSPQGSWQVSLRKFHFFLCLSLSSSPRWIFNIYFYLFLNFIFTCLLGKHVSVAPGSKQHINLHCKYFLS